MASNSALVERVVQRASADPAFRAHLVADPKGAVESELGIAIPVGLKVRVVEERSDEFYIVLPPRESRAGVGDAAPAGVAGGDSSAWGPNRQIR
jgi:hypothetical protein